jgi:hypothetical protein
MDPLPTPPTPSFSMPKMKTFRRWVKSRQEMDAVLDELEREERDGWMTGINGLVIHDFGSETLVMCPLTKFPNFADPYGGLLGPPTGLIQNALSPEELQQLYTPPASEAPDDKELYDEAEHGLPRDQIPEGEK